MLILKTLTRGSNHGYGIAQYIQRVSGEALRVGEGSLYPALQRLEKDGLVTSEWGTTDNNRRARYYRLTAAGRKQLAEHTGNWDRLVRAVNRVLRPAED